ncbi:MAG: alpha/beta hydrolase-fold protein [Anaerolineae bacterium]
MAVHKLIIRARQEGTPLLDGDSATFVWQGERPPRIIGDFNGWDPNAAAQFQRVARGVWAYTLKLHPATYMEYVYISDDEEEARVDDPYNRRRISNGMGKFNHTFDMPACQHTTLVRARADIARGTLSKHTLEHPFFLAGGKRSVWLYQPPSTEPAPLVIVFDGDDYLRRQYICTILDNLIAQGRIRPLALALVAHGRQARFLEYVASEATLAWISEDVIEVAQKHLNLVDIQQHPGAFGVLGASMGGLMALYAGLRMPALFGQVISQSGAFQMEMMKPPPLIRQMIAHYAGAPLNIWMNCGLYEYLLSANRAVRPLLSAHHVTYREYAGGHNPICWRDELPHAFETLFPLQAG